MLSEAQKLVIDRAFESAAGTDGCIPVSQLEALVAKLFHGRLSDAMLDIVIDLTDGSQHVTRDDMRAIVAAVMDKTTFWGALTTQASGRLFSGRGR